MSNHDEGNKAGVSLDRAGLSVIEKVGGARAKQMVTVAAAVQAAAPVIKWGWERRFSGLKVRFDGA